MFRIFHETRHDLVSRLKAFTWSQSMLGHDGAVLCRYFFSTHKRTAMAKRTLGPREDFQARNNIITDLIKTRLSIRENLVQCRRGICRFRTGTIRNRCVEFFLNGGVVAIVSQTTEFIFVVFFSLFACCFLRQLEIRLAVSREGFNCRSCCHFSFFCLSRSRR